MADFCDFNLIAEDKINITRLLKSASNLGYDVVAINYEMADLLDAGKKMKFLNIKSPEDIKPDVSTQQILQETRRKPFKVLSRFSTVVKDNLHSSKLAMPEIQKFDLISIQPLTESTFHNACGVLDIDIISLNLSEKLPFYIRKQSINLAIERGIHFEIVYSPAIRDQTQRRHIISNACDLVRVCKGKNIIITSGAIKPIELRGPYDIANLAQLFGLTFDQARDAVCSNCRAVLSRSASRRSVKSTITASILNPGCVSATQFQDKHSIEDHSDNPPRKKQKKLKPS